ncbi:hypothetical protein SAMN02745130_02719 [Thiothrix eikelboomii]|uniref:Uncharacterized protein n=1 Tax=Thiothrix eikelboomii TaxID=92487 RepID=A0A1T4XA64_9GAMM|nr:hypothetical protein [Thiothrix eikelboomii]SKA86484.1 hypothetical protein SAMN02745130_02719 [Thiothrix eikelboomii]
MTVKDTQLDLMHRKLEQHQAHEQRGLLLLKLGFLLTFLLYLLFNQHLYLGDALSWSAYFKDAASIFGFVFTVAIVVLMALFLSWVKHHAYLHFGFFGSVALVVSTVIGFALFAEFFSSSANQDVKASVLVERNSAYQATLNTESTPASAMNTGLITSIANAEQKLARCEANLKLGKEKHCDGDRAKVNALKSSEQSANHAQAQANIERDKLKYARQDELKAQSYNPVILTLARVLAGESGDYKDYLKTAVVLITLFVAVCFEILHHFLSKSHGASMAAIEDLELALAKYSEQPEPVLPSALATVQPITEPTKQPMGFGFPSTRPNTAQGASKPVLFKYQAQGEPETKAHHPIGFTFPTVAKSTLPKPSLGTQEEQLSLPDFGSFKARRDTFASPALSEAETIADEPRIDPVHGLMDDKPRIDPVHGVSEGVSLYPAWVQAVNQGLCKPSVDATRAWIQKCIAPTMTGSKTNDLKRIDLMRKAFFSRAMKEGLMQENPNYRNGGKKYLWIRG